MSCFTCSLTSTNDPHINDPHVVLRSDLVVVNQYVDSTENRCGWLVVSPRRHVTSLVALTDGEWTALSACISALDGMLRDRYGATRTMTASLGWEPDDHVHFHVFPTFAADGEPTFGCENFDRFTPISTSIDTFITDTRRLLPLLLTDGTRPLTVAG